MPACSASRISPHTGKIGKHFSRLPLSMKAGLHPAQIASLLALILAWVYIFDTVMKERELLENPQEGIVGAIPRDVESQVAHAPQSQPNQNGRSGDACSRSHDVCPTMHKQSWRSDTNSEKARCAGNREKGIAAVIVLQNRISLRQHAPD